jgi:hypothetical protein
MYTRARARGESGWQRYKSEAAARYSVARSCLYKTDWHHDKINTIQEQSSYYGGVL